MRRTAILVSLGLCLSWVALAQPAGPVSKKKCKETLSTALQSYQAGDFEVALPIFEQGFSDCKDAEFLAYTGFSLYSLHRYQEAEKIFNSYLTDFKKGKSQKEIQALLKTIPAILQTKITVQTTPPNATLWIDSKTDAPIGKSPFDGNVPPGKRLLIAELEGYSRAELVVDITEGGSTPVQLTLNEAPSKVSINTDPQGAEVLIDGTSAGVTPFAGKVQPGKHQIRVQKEGYGVLIYPIEASLGKAFTFQDKLPPPVAILSFVLPEGVSEADISINGKPLEKGKTKIEVPGGDHDITAKIAGYRVYQTTVAATAGQAYDVKLEPKKQGLYVDIQPDTKEAKIVSGGKETSNQMYIPLGQSAPVEVTQPGKLPYRQTFAATLDQDLLVKVQMSPPRLDKTKDRIATAAVIGAVGLGAATFAGIKYYGYEIKQETPTRSEFLQIKISAGVADACLAGTLITSYLAFKLYKKEKSGAIGSSPATVTTIPLK